MAENQVEVKVVGQVTDLKAAMDQGASSVDVASAKMREAMSKTQQQLSASFSKLKTEFSQGLSFDLNNADATQAKAKEIFASTRTEVERLRARLAELNQLQRVGAIDADTHARGVAKITDELKRVDGSASGLDKIKSGLTGVGGAASGAVGALGKIPALIGTIIGALAGGALKGSVDATKEFTSEANLLARTLGITASEASTLNVALGDVYTDADTYASAAAVLNRQIKTQEDRLNELGLVTRKSNGEFRSMTDLMRDSVTIVNGYKEGFDKTAAATDFFGRGAKELTGVLRVNQKVIEDAAQKQRELGLVVGQESVESLRQYRAAMNDAGDVLLGVKKVIGDALLPILTSLGNWFASLGPAAIALTRGAVLVLAGSFWTLKTGVVTVAAVLSALVTTFAEPIMSLGRAVMRLVSGDLSGAADAMKGVGDRVKSAWDKALIDVADSAQETRNKVQSLVMQGFETPNAPKAEKGNNYTPKKDKEKKEKEESLIPQFEAELSERKAALTKQNAQEGTFRKFTLEQETAFWQEKLRVVDKGSKDGVAVEKKVNDLIVKSGEQAFQERMAQLNREIAEIDNNAAKKLDLVNVEVAETLRAYGEQSKEYQAILIKRHEAEKAVRAEAFGDLIARLRNEEVLAENNADRKVEIVAREVEATAVMYGKDTKNYEDALKRQLQAKKAAVEQRKQIEAITSGILTDRTNAELEADRSEAQALYEQRRITLEQLLALDVEFESRRSEMRRAELLRQLALTSPELDPVKYAEIKRQIEAEELQHQAKMREIQRKVTANQNAPELAVFNTMEQSFATAIEGMLLKAQTLRQGLTGIFNAISGTFIQEMVAKPLAQFAGRVVRESALYQALFGAQVGSQAAASGTIAAIKSGETVGVVGMNAAQAASGAAASQAGIPIVGPALAIGAALAMLSFVKGIGGGGGGSSTTIKSGSITRPSAARGYDIPAGVNPVTQLHEREMVLPSSIADPLRQSLATGSGLPGGGGQGGGAVSINISAMDGASVKSWLKRGGAQQIASALGGHARNFRGA